MTRSHASAEHAVLLNPVWSAYTKEEMGHAWQQLQLEH